jgi:hypothetical protein
MSSLATGLAIAGALDVGDGVGAKLAHLANDVRSLQHNLLSELGGKGVPCFQAPDTLTQAYADAQAAQQALAEQGGGKKRRILDEAAEAAKRWAPGPGDSLVDADVAPFLAYNEEFFRHFNPEDVAGLIPDAAARPEDDPDFRVPALGRYYVLGAPPPADPPPPARFIFWFSPTFSVFSPLSKTKNTKMSYPQPPPPPTPRHAREARAPPSPTHTTRYIASLFA